MSRDMKLGLVLVAIILGLVGWVIWSSSRVESPLEGQVVELVYVTHSGTTEVEFQEVLVEDLLWGYLGASAMSRQFGYYLVPSGPFAGMIVYRGSK